MKKNLFKAEKLLAWQEVDELNWKTLVKEIASIFIDAGAVQMDQLTHAWANRDLSGVSRAAHSLKSSCGNVGAYEAQCLLEEIEHASANANTEEVVVLMSRLPSIFSESCAEVSNFVKALHAA